MTRQQHLIELLQAYIAAEVDKVDDVLLILKEYGLHFAEHTPNAKFWAEIEEYKGEYAIFAHRQVYGDFAEWIRERDDLNIKLFKSEEETKLYFLEWVLKEYKELEEKALLNKTTITT